MTITFKGFVALNGVIKLVFTVQRRETFWRLYTSHKLSIPLSESRGLELRLGLLIYFQSDFGDVDTHFDSSGWDEGTKMARK